MRRWRSGFLAAPARREALNQWQASQGRVRPTPGTTASAWLRYDLAVLGLPPISPPPPSWVEAVVA